MINNINKAHKALNIMISASVGCYTETIKKNQCKTNVYIDGIAVLCYRIITMYKTPIDQSESVNHHFRSYYARKNIIFMDV